LHNVNMLVTVNTDHACNILAVKQTGSVLLTCPEMSFKDAYIAS